MSRTPKCTHAGSRILFWSLVLLFIAPYFMGLVISGFRLGLPADFASLLARSILQALASSFGALILGCIGAMGLLKRHERWEFVALVPAVAPAIALVLGFFSIFPQWKGWSAVVAAHALSSCGLVAVVVSRLVRGTFGASLELAWVEGASRRTIWLRGILPALRVDLTRLALSVFAATLASFSIPLLLGGSKAMTLEIAIHHAIRFENAWPIAATLSLLQWLLLLVLVLFLSQKTFSSGALNSRASESGRLLPGSSLRTELGRVLGFDFALITVLVAPALIAFALLRGPVQGVAQLQSAGLFEHFEILKLAFRGGFVTSTLAGILSASLLFLFAASSPSAKERTWVSSYVAPSVAITGFATLVIGWGTDPSLVIDSVRIAVGAAFLFAPVLWRLRWEAQLARIDGALGVAETLGASRSMVIRKILMPELREIFFWSAGLVSFWVWGDYGIGSIAASRQMTLALVAKGLLESYRLEAASLLVLATLIFGGVSYWIFTWGGRRVAR